MHAFEEGVAGRRGTTLGIEDMPGPFLGKKGIFEDVTHPEYSSSARTSVPSGQRMGPSSVLANSSQSVNTFGGNFPSVIQLSAFSAFFIIFSGFLLVSMLIFFVLLFLLFFGIFVVVFDC